MMNFLFYDIFLENSNNASSLEEFFGIVLRVGVLYWGE